MCLCSRLSFGGAGCLRVYGFLECVFAVVSVFFLWMLLESLSFCSLSVALNECLVLFEVLRVFRSYVCSVFWNLLCWLRNSLILLFSFIKLEW